ncbi:MAG: NAD(P)-binding protein [Hyphomicrobiaceae bacterium]|nr:NAD(P)-binding protein [Hyphomicrobiaceae bacterium]MCC0008793.1 NAD(P)-binding protein [Hyphomicrobiaceae bacterium]
MTETATSPTKLTYRRYRDGESPEDWTDMQERIFQADRSYKCPTYVHRTPPCQGSCPSGHDVRGWLSIARGLDKPADKNTPWQEYAFTRMVESNPFPAIMGRVCPAPCEDGCNRNEVDDYVGINSIEHYVGQWAIEHKLKLPAPSPSTGKKVAVVGSGPAGLAAAYFLRRKGHAVTIFEMRKELGGMMRYGIPGYRTPRDVLDAEIQRILDLGVDVVTEKKIGVDIALGDLEKDFDAVFMAIGAQSGSPLTIPGAEKAPNCISGIAFLTAFNDGRLKHSSARVLVIGGGDTAMDVAAVARRLGHIEHTHEKDRPEYVVLGQTAHDVATIAKRQGAEVIVVYRRPIEKMPAAKQEIEHVLQEGVKIQGSLAPVEVVLDGNGRARALKVIRVDWTGGKMKEIEGSEHEIECDLVVAAIGQAGDFSGMEDLNNGKGLIKADQLYRWPGRPGIFVGGDIIKPHLLTTAIGHASIASESIDHYVAGSPPDKRPKVDVHHFNLLGELQQRGLAPEEYPHGEVFNTDSQKFAIHNYEDRSQSQIVPHDMLFLGHFKYEARHVRSEKHIGDAEVLGNFEERLQVLLEKQAQEEAARCMSCGMCFECDNCMIYCPQQAVERVPKKERALGRYVTTVYSKCIGCHICADVCPSGYIQMGLGE